MDVRNLFRATYLSGVVIASTLATPAHADTYTGSAQIKEYCAVGICYPTAGGFSLLIDAAPATPLSAGTLTVEWYGESNDSGGEWLDITIDGFSFGRLADSNPANDPFNGVGAVGADGWDMNYGVGRDSLIKVSTEISHSTLLAIVSDGKININGRFGYDVDDYGTGEYVKFTLSYNTSPVPEPATGWLLLAGLGMGAPWARRKLRKTAN